MCVAQLDRALGYGPRCRGFESSHARPKKYRKPLIYKGLRYFFALQGSCFVLLFQVVPFLNLQRENYLTRWYIRWEMTPTSIGGEKQVSISGGSQSPIWYSLRQDYRGAQLKYVMQLHDAHLATRMPEHSWILEKGLNLDDNLWYNKCLIDDGCSLKKVCFVKCTNLEN